MAIVSFLIHLSGAVMLLLFAVRMVQTGIERSYGAAFQRMMIAQHNVGQASLAGTALAVALQSSTAVSLLAMGFAASGILSFPIGLAIVLGGDFGSALIVQILSFKLEWLIPVLLMAGGYLFVKTEAKKPRQIGRILMGVALILLSLRFLGEAMDPIRESNFLPAITSYLERDSITAFLVGAALVFVMHSSVAVILMCVTLVEIGDLPFAAGLSLMLGANCGSGLIAIWLSRGIALTGRRLAFANMALRTGWSVIILFAANYALRGGVLGDLQGGQMVVLAHLGFNASLLFLSLPFCRRLDAPLQRFLPEPAKPKSSPDSFRPTSALDMSKLIHPSQALASLKREVLRMSDLVEAMFRPSLALYKSGTKEQIQAVRGLDSDVNDCLSGIRTFVAAIPTERYSQEDVKMAHDLMEHAIRLETAGDVVARRLTVLADEMRRKRAAFSKDGWNELVHMHEGILANIKLASNVLISDDLESARLLSLEKTQIKRAERNSRRHHIKRLRHGSTQSYETSDIHLETLHSFREFNSHIAAVAYPILYRNGQLLETRLVEKMSATEGKK